MEKKYQGEGVAIQYNLRRCIHAELCVKNMRQVFDPERRPWIDATQAPADAIVDIVSRCPSGALHSERTDGGEAESAPETNAGALWADGPIALHGDIQLQAAGVNDGRNEETRVTLCRCGASKNKPYCDNTHKTIGWTATETAVPEVKAFVSGETALTVNASKDGPYEVHGPLTLTNAAGDVVYAGEQTWLCRCGASNNKPFCDGTHNSIGFSAE